MRHTHHTRKFFLHYPLTLGERLYSFFIGPILGIVIFFVVLKLLALTPGNLHQIAFGDLFVAGLYTLGRLFISYILALLVAIPLALLATSGSIAEKILLPTFDILESVPVLAFFPILIFFFIQLGFTSGAAIFIIFLSMLWNIVFTVAGGLKMIPKDITSAAEVFGIRKFQYFKKVILPAIFPEIVTGSILAFAQGWNIIIVAEVIHTYIPMGTPGQDLFGIGSMLVNASATGQTDVFIACIGVMIVIIGLLNYFVWQKLIHYAERFKFE